MKRFFLIIILIGLSGKVVFCQEQTPAVALFNSMMENISKVHTCTYVLNMDERIFGKFGKAQYITKVNTSPYKVYTYSVFPNPGAEALYIEDHNDGKVLVNPNRFPFINLNLSMNSMLLRKRHQYSLLDMGFSYLYNIMEKNIQKYGNKFYGSLSVASDITYNNREYHVLEINNPGFRITTYQVQEGENVTAIANKLLVNDHMILELNSNISDYDDVKKGEVIRVPESFAKRIVLYLDKDNFLPLVQMIYDDKGLYSKIEISSFRMNPVITDEEFSQNCPKYNF